jgi:hypothetical protein
VSIGADTHQRVSARISTMVNEDGNLSGGVQYLSIVVMIMIKIRIIRTIIINNYNNNFKNSIIDKIRFTPAAFKALMLGGLCRLGEGLRCYSEKQDSPLKVIVFIVRIIINS